MRVLRMSIYADGTGEQAATLVTVVDDLIAPVEEVIQKARQPGLFMVHEVVEVPETAEPARTLYVQGRIDTEREKHMALLYYWDADALKRVTPGGALTASKPAPLSAEEIVMVFEQLRTHPNYNNHKVIGIAEDMRVVTLDPQQVRIEVLN